MDRFSIPFSFIQLLLTGEQWAGNSGEQKTGANLKVGDAFIFHGWQLSFRSDHEYWLGVYDSASDMRFLDVPMAHHGETGYPGDHTLLDAVVYWAIHDFTNTTEVLPLKEYIQNGGDPPELPKYTPQRWQGAPAIPVEFMKVYGLRTGQSEKYQHHVFAHIRVGHHLVFWNQLVYDPDCPENPARLQSEAIHDGRVVDIVNGILKENRYRLEQMSDQRRLHTDDEWMVAPNGSVPDELVFPPIEWN